MVINNELQDSSILNILRQQNQQPAQAENSAVAAATQTNEDVNVEQQQNDQARLAIGEDSLESTAQRHDRHLVDILA